MSTDAVTYLLSFIYLAGWIESIVQVCSARVPEPADHVVQMQRHPVGVRDGDVQDPLDALANVILQDHQGFTLVGVVVCGT